MSCTGDQQTFSAKGQTLGISVFVVICGFCQYSSLFVHFGFVALKKKTIVSLETIKNRLPAGLAHELSSVTPELDGEKETQASRFWNETGSRAVSKQLWERQESPRILQF